MILLERVSLRDVQPQIILAMTIADALYRECTGAEMQVFSVREGEHASPSSLHYTGGAFDSRINAVGLFSADAVTIAREGRRRLGPDFDVVIESRDVGSPPVPVVTHLHWEYDPKPARRPLLPSGRA